MDTPTAVANDPLQVRAFFVGRGKDAVEFAIVDSQGWFAGYQEGPFGVTDARAHAAAKIATLGYEGMTQANIIVSSTHSHAAPTIMGIWGPTDPEYLKRVHDATVEALFQAATPARTRYAQLWTGAGSIATIIAHAVNGTDHYDGWSIDDETPFLWARDPQTLATVGMYVNVPVHADSYKGSACGIMSADTPGVIRSTLDLKLGGTAVVAMGTLGRQETIGPSACGDRGADEVARDGRFIANRIFAGMVHASPVTDGTLAGAETYILTPGTNPALLALVYANTQGFQCIDGVACTIDRSVMPPYLVGNNIGTYITSLRIGSDVWVSEPGEAFAEVSQAIRDSVVGARAVHVVGMAQDQLGYYYPPEDYPSTEMNPSDFLIYNVGPALADQNVHGSALNATKLGFYGLPQHPMMANDEPHRYLEPGVQFFPIPIESAARTVSFTGYAHISGAHDFDPSGALPFSSAASMAHFDFGDGSTLEQVDEEFDHTFPGPGSYDVSATTHDEQGQSRTFTQRVVIDEALQALVGHDGNMLRPGSIGGDGHILAVHWRFGDGSTADGFVVPAPAPGVSITLTVVDGAGDTATVTV